MAGKEEESGEKGSSLILYEVINIICRSCL